MMLWLIIPSLWSKLYQKEVCTQYRLKKGSVKIYVKEICKTRENLIFLKNGKNSKNCRNGSGMPEKKFRSRMMKRTSPLILLTKFSYP